MRFQTIGIREVEACRRKPNTVLIDLRTKEEYGLHHLEGAKNIPYEELENYKGSLSKSVTYIFYCDRGGSSLMVAKELSGEGYRVCTVIGGMQAWEENSYCSLVPRKQ